MKRSIVQSLLVTTLLFIQSLSATTAKNDILYVHMITHSHDDVGWLKTVDMYYTGTNNTIQRAEVHFILDTSIAEILKDPVKRFTYTEMKFFSMWWKDQTEQMKNAVRTLVKEGRLELINGGWSMHDEACPHYEDMINNMMKGHEFITKEFGVQPRIGWQIDPFGHSNTNARLFAEMGFDAVIFARSDWQEKIKRKNESSMEFLWRPSFSYLGKSSQILAHTMMGLYFPPDYFGFDTLDVDDVNGPFIDDESLSTFNADYKAKAFVDYVLEMRNHYMTNHLLMPMGGDFEYSNAHMYFDSIDRMIRYTNKNFGDQVQLIYSTPSEYVDALINSNITWPVRYDDMFPYADTGEDYWTGYFTSRPTAKRHVREGSQVLHASNKLYALRVLDQSVTDAEISQILGSKHTMLDSLGIYQHHDAITGTAKQFVANDYTYRLHKSMVNNSIAYTNEIAKGIKQLTGVFINDWSQCTLTNGTYLDCPVANNIKKSFLVTVQNPLTIDVEYSRVKVPNLDQGSYSVQYWNGAAFQNVTGFTTLCHPFKLENGTEIRDCDLHIHQTIPASNLTLFLVFYSTVSDSASTNKLSKIGYMGEDSDHGSHFILYTDNGNYDLYFQLRYYKSNMGGDAYNNSDNVPSGAYLFKPDKNETQSVVYNKLKGMEALSGDFVQDIWLEYSDDDQVSKMAYLKVYAYENSPFIEFDVLLEPLPVTSSGIELTVNFYQPNISQNSTFYTDSNGLEMQKRVLNLRPDGTVPDTHYNSTSNYYPINSAIVIKDKNYQLTVMNDRSQGGSSLFDGRIELMQNRRLFLDDRRGVGEPLSENGTSGLGNRVRATYFVQFMNTSVTSSQRFQQMQIDEPLQYFYSFKWTTNSNNIALQQEIKQVLSSTNIPVKIEAFPVDKNIIMVRFENIADLFDYPTLSDTNVYVDVTAYAENLWNQANSFTASYNSINIVELAVTGNQSQKDRNKKRVEYKGMDDQEIVEPVWPSDKQGYVISLTAQRIRTFQIEYKPLSNDGDIKFLSE